ncbi:hypothetical protein BOVA604_3613 [Bacteroides ovatus]|nr:hypothetical protein BOVA604_3613 [Bacteroides ovatus]
MNHTVYFVVSMIVCRYERRENTMGKESAGLEDDTSSPAGSKIATAMLFVLML